MLQPLTKDEIRRLVAMIESVDLELRNMGIDAYQNFQDACARVCLESDAFRRKRIANVAFQRARKVLEKYESRRYFGLP